ncbi:hypothetical protein ABBQ32_008819 [Trebouxia sp. C0010 RCD-2024]
MYRRQAFRLVLKAANKGTFALMLIALSDQKEVLAGRTPFKSSQPLQHAQLNITERLDATSTLDSRTLAMHQAIVRAIMRPGKPVNLSAPAAVPMLEALDGVDWDNLARDCSISPEEPLTKDDHRNKKRKEMEDVGTRVHAHVSAAYHTISDIGDMHVVQHQNGLRNDASTCTAIYPKP